MEAGPKYETEWSIAYAMRFGRRQSKLFERVSKGIKLIILGAGTTAFVSAVGDATEIVKWAGIATGLLAIADAIWNPAGLAAKSREQEAKYAMLNRDAPQMTAGELKRAFDALYDSEIAEVEALRPVAFNDTVNEIGNSTTEECDLNWWQRFMAWLTGGVAIHQYD